MKSCILGIVNFSDPAVVIANPSFKIICLLSWHFANSKNNCIGIASILLGITRYFG
jgi:hypothetical protein